VQITLQSIDLLQDRPGQCRPILKLGESYEAHQRLCRGRHLLRPVRFRFRCLRADDHIGYHQQHAR
jgi:hypothetical protein